MEKNDFNNNNKLTAICQSCWLVLILCLILILINPLSSQGSIIDDLNRQISQQEQKRAELERQAAEYQKLINQKKGEIRSLNNEIGILDAQIGKLEVEINITEEEIYQTELEILRLSYGVEQAAEDIITNKTSLGAIIRTINEYDQTSDVEVILSTGTLSDFFNQLAYIESLQSKVQTTVDDLQDLKVKLTENKASEEIKKGELENLKEELTEKQSSVAYQKSSRKSLLNRTKGEENKYQQMLADIEKQKKAILGDINRLISQKSTELARLEAELAKPPQEYWASTSWFFSQDDPRWAELGIGRTNSSMANYGCAISSVAMVFTYLGNTITPGQLAKEPIFYYDLIVWPQKWNSIRLTTLTYRTLADWFKIDREIGAGYPVIVRIQADGRDGGHYVVIHHKGADGRYIVHDPLFGANIYLDSSRAFISKLYGTTTSINQMIIYH